jgi:hypothetical protein
VAASRLVHDLKVAVALGSPLIDLPNITTPDRILIQAREPNSPAQARNLPGLLASLLDQLINLGETAAQIKRASQEGNVEDL